jgi:hypothetical protein
MRRLLFLLHGVGEHGAGWADKPGGPAAVLREASRGYAAFRKRPLDDRARLVPLSYADLLDAAAGRWRQAAVDQAKRAAEGAGEAARRAGELLRQAPWLAKAADALEEGAAKLGPLAERLGGLPDLSELVRQLPAVDAAWPDHASDVAAWRADAACRDEVRARVAAAVRAELLPLAEDGGRVNAVFAAHSLGTAVAHDVLDELGRRWLASRGPYSPRRWRWRAVFMLADVSRLLAVGGPESLLRAGPEKDPHSWARSLYEVRHAWDPIDRAVPKADAARRGARRLDVGHAWRANVHSFGHYLEHPAVHIPLLRAACGSGTVTRGEEAAALAAAAARPSVVDEAARKVKGMLGRDLK